MADPVAQIVAELAELRRRIAALETAPRASSTAIRAGALQILDDTGALVAEFGRRSDGLVGLFVYGAAGDGAVLAGQIGGGQVGLKVLSGAGREMFTVDDTGGQSTPIPTWPWIPNPGEPDDTNGRKTTTSAVYSDLWRTTKVFAYGDQLGFDFALSIPAGTTIDARVTVAEMGGAVPVAVWTGAGLTSSTVQVQQVVTIPPSATVSGTDSVLGRYFNLAFQVRRTSGAGVPGASPLEPSRIYP